MSQIKLKKIVYSWPILILLLIIVLLIGKSVWGVYKSEKISSDNKLLSEKKYEELEERSKLISSEIEMLKTEKGIETEIRDKFRVAKEGEQLAIIINSGENLEDKTAIKEEGFWTKIWNFLRD